MDPTEVLAAVDSIMPQNRGRSIFDPPDTHDPSPSPVLDTLSPLAFTSPTSNRADDSSDEENRVFISKYDAFIPKSASSSGTPRVRLKKTPRLRNPPTCKHVFKKGPKKNETCGRFCFLGDEYCCKHRKTESKPPVCKVKLEKPPSCKLDLETFAVKKRFERLQVSGKYRLLKSTERAAILERGGKIIKVRLPNHLKPIPKTGSFLKFKKDEKIGQKERPRAMWECV